MNLAKRILEEDKKTDNEKWELYRAVQKYLVDTYGAYSLDRNLKAKFSIGWGGVYMNEIHKEMIGRYGFKVEECQKGKYIKYSHKSGLAPKIFLDETQAPARYYFIFDCLV